MPLDAYVKGRIYYGVSDMSVGVGALPHAADSKSCGRCGARYEYAAVFYGHLGLWRCLAPAVDHHHCVKPRRSHTTPALVIHLCRRHHDQCSASYRTGRLLITPNGDGAFTCAVVQKAGKWTPP